MLEPWLEPWMGALSGACYAAGPLLALLHHLLHPLDYWRCRGVTSDEGGVPLLGSFASSLLQRTSFQEDLDALYARHKESGAPGVLGVFQWRQPAALVCHPALVARLLEDKEGELPLAAPLAVPLVPRAVRDRLSPLLLAGRVDAMARLVADCAAQLVQLMSDQVVRGRGAGRGAAELDLVEPLTRFTAGLVGACAFGVPCNCIRDPDSELHQVSARARRPPLLSLVALAAVTACPALAPLLPARLLYPAAACFYVDMLRETQRFRERSRARRRDFVELLMSAGRAAGRGDGRDFLTDKDRRHHVELAYDVIAAQTYVFDVAGEDSVVNTVVRCLHELALQPGLQRRVATEVRAALADEELALEALRAMPLLDRVVLETLRLYPPCGVLAREVAAESTLPGTEVTLRPGTRLYVNVKALHRDPDLYPEPLRFDPERFSHEDTAVRPPGTFIPFGEPVASPPQPGQLAQSTAGRFAEQAMRLCLAALLRDLEFSPGHDPGDLPDSAVALRLRVQA